MPPGHKKESKRDAEPDEITRAKFRAKCRFRAIGRLVIANAYWLMEDVEYQGDNVRRRVEQAVRTKKKQLLSIKDKALLNKPVELRTESEKKYLYRIIGGLKCFKRYPNNVKKKLAALTYFKYYGPDRVVVRQRQQAQALYFIVSGEVKISHLVYDELLKKEVKAELGAMSAGEMFGEVSLLHNIPRSATVTTADHCEFLVLHAEDFKKVLLTSVQKQWDEVRTAMSMFTYFEQLDEVSSREGCLVAKLKSYQPNDVLLGDGCGIPNHVYFILTGSVQMIESLQVIAVKGLAKTFYYLYDPYQSKQASEEDFEKKWFSVLNKPGSTLFDKSILKASSSFTKKRSTSHRISYTVEEDDELVPKKQTHSRTSNQEAQERSEGWTERKIKQEEIQTERKRNVKDASKEGLKNVEEKEEIHTESKITLEGKIGSRPKLTREISTITRNSEGKLTIKSKDDVHNEEEKPEYKRISIFWGLPPDSDRESTGSCRVSVPEMHPLLSSGRGKMRTYFMQVCRMNPGSTFGFGENMRDRRMVALTPVTCMLMPKVWLLQKNIANIWTRIQYYLEKKIPNKATLFEEFKKQREWLVFREDCVEEAIKRSSNVNNTSLHDVPYAIRLEEMVDI